ncbi:SAM-dependent methyltransferase [Bradyrhizobium algeriense]|uniref:SAM-dependent methyltransferase n=1 Tax=Bradyrhizobium algeriense TaxID=634784 RepID=A0ABU8BFH3_9BRAD
MIKSKRQITNLRPDFERIYASCIIGAGFFESDDYYRHDQERYWRSLEIFCELDLPRPARILEIGGGQMAVMCSKLFNDECVVGDISDQFIAPIERQNIPFIPYNLMSDEEHSAKGAFDAVVLLEVIEHVPVPAYVLFERIKRLLKPGGILFLTTPNLFRLRNLIRMFLGIEFLDRFLLPQPGQGLGHQLEYSANHLDWQLERAGLSKIFIQHDELGRVGHSSKARLARRLLAPLRLRPIWRDGLVAAARN